MANRQIIFWVITVSLLVIILMLVCINNVNAPGFTNEHVFTTVPSNSASSTVVSQSFLSAPLINSKSRITKKPFGIYVSPGISSISPERFTSYHTGADFEIFAGEENIDVSVTAVCSGKMIEKKQARGYGGMVIQSCVLDSMLVTVVYGHLKISTVKTTIGSTINSGDLIGFLGAGYSTETDNERKHLHLGIHKGKDIDSRGYVKSKSELSAWINVAEYLK